MTVRPPCCRERKTSYVKFLAKTILWVAKKNSQSRREGDGLNG